MIMNRELVNRYEKIYGKKQTKSLIEISKKIINQKYIRINKSKISKEEVIKFLKKNRVKFSETFLEDCIKIDKTFFNLSSSILNLNGSIYLQDIASQIPVNCINFNEFQNKKIKVLDMAAAPGSKTTQIVDRLDYEKIDYELIAIEPEKKRLQKLMNNIQRQDCKNIKVMNIKGQEINLNNKFDIILLDAPCSGNIAGDRNWLSKRDIKGIKDNSKIQKELLTKANEILSEKGILIYSTCSLEKEENEDNVQWAKDNLDLIDLSIALSIPFNSRALERNCKAIRLFPAESKTQGFFVSILKKKN